MFENYIIQNERYNITKISWKKKSNKLKFCNSLLTEIKIFYHEYLNGR